MALNGRVHSAKAVCALYSHGLPSNLVLGNSIGTKRAEADIPRLFLLSVLLGADLAPIVDDIDAGNVVTRIVRSLHRAALDVGAESLLAHGTIRLVAAHIRPRSE